MMLRTHIMMLRATAERKETMTAHGSTATSVLSRRALLLNDMAMAALAAFSPVMAAAIGEERPGIRRPG
jgi:hypothetical protein